MRGLKTHLVICMVLLLMGASATLALGRHNCRFWGGISPSIPHLVLDGHLVELPHSIENLSSWNRNGWSVAYYDSNPAPVVHRGKPPANADRNFRPAVAEACAARPRIAISHVRNCSSGLCDIPNPHPFQREKNGRHWLMAHNGSIDKDILLRLIRPDYLAANPPEIGVGPKEWVDSELYFLLMLQSIEDEGWQVGPGLGLTVQLLQLMIPGDGESLNFVMSDGERLWAYREGATLYYLHQTGGLGYSAVASQFPTEEQGPWVTVGIGELLTMSEDTPPLIEKIEDYFDPTAVPVSGGNLRISVNPNPASGAARLRCSLAQAGAAQLTLFDISGRHVCSSDLGLLGPGHHSIMLPGVDERGRALPAGVYLVRLTSTDAVATAKVLLLR